MCNMQFAPYLVWKLDDHDRRFPKILKEKLGIRWLYGIGDPMLLHDDGIAIVGSRNAKQESLTYAGKLGSYACINDFAVISGNARGVDKAAMFGSLQSGGKAVGVLPNGISKINIHTQIANYIADGKLLYISQFDPSSDFQPDHAMMRNHTIFALSALGVAVTSAANKGGTWNGVVQQLKMHRLVPIYVRDANEIALNKFIAMGARRLPDINNEKAMSALFTSFRPFAKPWIYDKTEISELEVGRIER